MWIRIDNQDGEEYYCQAFLDTGSSCNMISARRVSELGLSYKETTKEEEEENAITDLDGTKSYPLGSLKIDYKGGHHGHSPQSAEASTFLVLDDVPCSILLGRDALNELHVFALDRLYFSKPPGNFPEERILKVPEDEKRRPGVYFAEGRKGPLRTSKTFFPGPPITVRPIKR
ncbi:hypothetical protein SLS56_012211 [Neofusicoccum ribis]|uniref:Gag-pol polyprotein n=1 Tax=Neofusicoccum ribis TaxID=45134 RepID=A0ABR3S9H5_9PEZI